MPRAQLVELYAHGLGVIDDARLEFGPGFTVLTGETGAGKTLLIGALDLCLGGDGHSARYAVSSELRAAAVFDAGATSEVIMSREATSNGRLRCSLNGVPSSVEALRAAAVELIVVHGQHDSLSLRNRGEVLRIIDASAGISTAVLDGVRRQLHQDRSLREQLGGDAQRRERDLDYLDFQIGELEAVAIVSPAELDDTMAELGRLSDLRDGQATLVEVIAQLDDDRDDAVLARFAAIIGQLPGDDVYEEGRAMLRGALEQAREGVMALASMSDPDAFDPALIDQLDERVAVLQQIARKHGGSLERAVLALEELRLERGRLADAAASVVTLDERIVQLEQRERALAREARREREFAAVQLTNAVRVQLPRVALASASLRFVVAGDDGSDAQILFTPNPGQPEGPLQSLASGGELSRVLLALSLETAHEDVVAVFDEVDAGVGGQVAQQIGDCLRELARRQQVLAVTHLASVAAKADHHFVVEKSVTAGITSTSVREVRAEQRVDEIARMLAGDQITDESRALARRMLETRS